MRSTQPVINMNKYKQELITPEQFINLTGEQCRDILKVRPFVNEIGASSLDSTDFVSLIVNWKTPRYKVDL